MYEHIHTCKQGNNPYAANISTFVEVKSPSMNEL